jgi:hypothetical protein
LEIASTVEVFQAVPLVLLVKQQLPSRTGFLLPGKFRRPRRSRSVAALQFQSILLTYQDTFAASVGSKARVTLFAQ